MVAAEVALTGNPYVGLTGVIVGLSLEVLAIGPVQLQSLPATQRPEFELESGLVGIVDDAARMAW